MKLLGRLFGFLFAGCLGHLAVPAKSDVLVMLEARQLPFNCTEIGSCISTSTVLLRNIVDMDLNDATRLTQLLGQMEGASAVPDSDLVTMCVQAILPSMEDVPLSTKPELLAGHPGVFLDSASLDATEGMQGYSQYLQNRLLEAGVRILSKEEW
ncbi:MAG: hypothetical protein OXQ30_14315, partial [Boseongicola sp.]|nr:hypothetical protein [Boseongicola sp.]